MASKAEAEVPKVFLETFSSLRPDYSSQLKFPEPALKLFGLYLYSDSLLIRFPPPL
jgi:hypothetical protein